MRLFIIITHVFALLVDCSANADSEGQSANAYPFVFIESTGDNMFLLTDKKLYPIKRFSADSNESAVKALRSLGANILYENGGGSKIFLIGDYRKDDSAFVLTGWFILAPFLSREVLDENVLPHQAKLVLRSKLYETDFSMDVKDLSSYVLDITPSIVRQTHKSDRTSQPKHGEDQRAK